jgi:RNA polymerase sigma-70 factor (ECF subfamily)
MAAHALRRHYDLIFRYVRRRSRSQADAEDITQQVFADAAAALERLSSLTDERTLAWLYTVAQRRIADEIRRSSRRAHPADVPLGLAPTPQSEYGSRVARDIAAALNELPEAQRRVVVLKLFEGLSFSEIAGELGITEAAAKMRCLRGLEQARSILRREGIEP